jgi:hypothetical protein
MSSFTNTDEELIEIKEKTARVKAHVEALDEIVDALEENDHDYDRLNLIVALEDLDLANEDLRDWIRDRYNIPRELRYVYSD